MGCSMKYKSKMTVISIFLLCIVSLYMFSCKTYTLLESGVGSVTELDIATWNITVNEKNITTTLDNKITLDDITWDTSHTKDGKIAPGSVGTLDVAIDPNDTEVAVRFDLTVKDHQTDEDIVLTVTKFLMKEENTTLTRTDEHTYTGIFTLDQIEAEEKKTIQFEFSWINDESNNERDSEIGMGLTEGNFIEIHLVATQYLGEEIVPYTG